MPSRPPLPILAEWIAATCTVRITFDRPLVVGAYDERGWSARFANVQRDPIGVTVPAANPLTVLVRTTAGPPDLGADVASYATTPPDLIGQNGALVDAFTQPLVSV